MMRNSKYIAMALGVAVLLAGCSAKSPTAPKPTPAAGFTISLTPQSSTAKTGDYVLVVAQVNSGSGNAPDGTAVTFLVSGGHFDAVDGTGSYATQVIRTTSGGRASVSVTSSSVGQALLEGRVPGNSAQTTVSFGVGPTPPPGKITITSVIPNQGGPEGGDRVVITGSGFIEPLQVAFVVDGQPFLADVVFVAAGGTSMTVVTPRVVSSPPSTVDQVADVAVQAGPNTANLKGGFTYVAAIATPEIYVLSPNAGPFEGGTRVTITGKGFQTPVQVLFDDIQAQVVSSNYTEVVCISPSITPSAPSDLITKQVKVTNIKSGKASNSLGFQYGVKMFISSFSPMEGPADSPTTVTIFGQGFVAPVSVVATLGGQWDVLSVAGTEIVARTKPLVDNPHVCSGGSATFTVTNIGSNISYTSTQSFTYRGVHPLITSVLIGATNQVYQCGGTCAACVTPYTITVRGSGFQTTSTMTVTLDGSAGGSIGPLIATVTDANTLTIAVTDLSVFTMATTSCSPPTGGSRNVSTPVDVSVRNVRYDCSDRLNGALVVVPCDLVTCAAGPPPTPTPTPTTFLLTVTKTGNAAGGDITSLPAGLTPCTGATSPCTGNFNGLVTLTASVAVDWTGSCTPAGGTNPAASATVNVTAPASCNAAFP